MEFKHKLQYKNRKEKLSAVFERYKPILVDSILDVGADECYLLNVLPSSVRYTGIGLGSENANLLQINLEKDKIPYEDSCFHTVICLDVLEHLDNLHDVFNEICRVSSGYVLISLPNPYHDFLNYVFRGSSNSRNLKYYGLPVDKEPDRHKWFFSATEAKTFVKDNAIKNNFEVIDYYEYKHDRITRILLSVFFRLFFPKIQIEDFYQGTMWWVFKKRGFLSYEES